MSDPIIAGTVGLPIRLILLDNGQPHDAAAADERTITITRPDGSRVTVAADAAQASDGRACIEYVTQEGDLDDDGPYLFAGFIREGESEWPAMPVAEYVYPSGRD